MKFGLVIALLYFVSSVVRLQFHQSPSHFPTACDIRALIFSSV
jgi:hypothetical protein